MPLINISFVSNMFQEVNKAATISLIPVNYVEMTTKSTQLVDLSDLFGVLHGCKYTHTHTAPVDGICRTSLVLNECSVFPN